MFISQVVTSNVPECQGFDYFDAFKKFSVGCDFSDQSQMEGVLVCVGKYNSSFDGTVALLLMYVSSFCKNFNLISLAQSIHNNSVLADWKLSVSGLFSEHSFVGSQQVFSTQTRLSNDFKVQDPFRFFFHFAYFYCSVSYNVLDNVKQQPNRFLQIVLENSHSFKFHFTMKCPLYTGKSILSG